MAICNRCHKAEAKPGRKSCQGCIDQAVRSTRKLHQERKRLGVCAKCGGPLADRRKINCQKCRKRDVGYRMTIYQRRIRAGLCGDCGSPAAGGKHICEPCRKRRRESMRQKRATRPAARARARDSFTCQLCNDSEAVHLDAHHIDGNGRTLSRSVRNPEPNDDLDNLITLCRRCHLQVTYAISHPVNLSRFIYLVERGRESSRVT